MVVETGPSLRALMSEYAKWPEHPLKDVPIDILEAARRVLANAAQWNDVDPDLADPIADAVVAALLPWITWEAE